MLALLHLALWWDFPGAVSRSLILAHLGAFLLWQPLWQRDRRLAGGSQVTFLVVTTASIFWLDWWLMGFWIVVLLGILGGRIGYRPADRAAYMIGGCLLVFELIVAVVPEMFDLEAFSSEITRPLGWSLLLLPAVLAALKGDDSRPHEQLPVDFLYGLTIALLTLVLVFGALLAMYRFGSPYPVALFQTVLGIAAFLLVLGWLWTPFAGFSGLGPLWTRYLLNVGTPFEIWLQDVSRMASELPGSARFLDAAARRLVDFPWVTGCRWSTVRRQGLVGIETPHVISFSSPGLTLSLFTRRAMPPALRLHGQLLMQLMADFHTAKIREQELARRAHVQAVYETGARVTHDIKNLLQSLYALTSAVEVPRTTDRSSLQEFLARQLPMLAQRLRRALDRLQAPANSFLSSQQPLGDWWQEFARRHADQGIELAGNADAGMPVPGEFLDSTVENLIENARNKRQAFPELRIAVRIESENDRFSIFVEDDGEPVPAEIVDELFENPIPSRSGLGIGLYQSRTQADALGWTLEMDSNRSGQVRFALHGRRTGGADSVPGAAPAARAGFR